MFRDRIPNADPETPEIVSGDAPLPLDRLPLHLLESIFFRLSVADLIAVTAASRSLAAATSSDFFLSAYNSAATSVISDPFFLFHTEYHEGHYVISYRPSRGRWAPFKFIAGHKNFRPVAAAGHRVLLLSSQGNLVIASPFSSSSAVQHLGRFPPNGESSDFQVLAMAEMGDGGDRFAIVAVRTAEMLYTLMFDSAVGRWISKGSLNHRFAVLSNSAIFNDSLYCIALGPPDSLVKFDMVEGLWSSLQIVIPSLICPHVFVFKANLVIVGGVEEFGEIVGFAVWEMELNGVEKDLKLVCFMPESLLKSFAFSQQYLFEAVEMGGLVCLFSGLTDHVILFEIATRTWRWAPQCAIPVQRRQLFGCAVEPRIGLLKSFGVRYRNSNHVLDGTLSENQPATS